MADNQVACGQALIGALLEACLSRGIEPLLDTRATPDRHAWETQVSGLVDRPWGAQRTKIPATTVVLASGGYEWNPRGCGPGTCPAR